MLSITEPDLQCLASLHARDVVWLAAVIMGAKPIATLVIPLEVKGWFQQFCERYGLVHFEDEPSDPYQARIAVCQDEASAKLRKELKDIRSLFDEVRRSPTISQRKRACDESVKALTRLEGAIYGFPECCVEFHAEKGPSSRARAYEEFLESGRDQPVPVEFWAVAHAPCSSRCHETLKLGRKYLGAVAGFSGSLKDHVEARLLLPRFYQTGGGRFIDLKPLDSDACPEDLTVSRERFEKDASQHLPGSVEIVLCEVPRPYVLVSAPEEPPYKTSFPNPEMIGTMWLAYTPGYGAYMINAKTGELALYVRSDEWIQKVGEEWRSRSNFRVYVSKRQQ